MCLKYFFLLPLSRLKNNLSLIIYMDEIIEDVKDCEEKTKKCINPFCDFINSIGKIFYDMYKYVVTSKIKSN